MDQNLKDQEDDTSLDEKTKEELAEEFVEMMEAKLKRSQKHLWFIRDHEQLKQNE